jgi:hypothetical protein
MIGQMNCSPTVFRLHRKGWSVSKDIHAEVDGREMAKILREAKCMERYDRISHDILSEILVAASLDGIVEGGNRRGSDVISPDFGRVEVKSRILGTDGPFPRVSLKPSNLEKADYFVAVRWTHNFAFHDAVMLPKNDVVELYGIKVQNSGMAHIGWQDWCYAKGAISLKPKITKILEMV